MPLGDAPLWKEVVGGLSRMDKGNTGAARKEVFSQGRNAITT